MNKARGDGGLGNDHSGKDDTTWRIQNIDW